jgi:hypothetical protein
MAGRFAPTEVVAGAQRARVDAATASGLLLDLHEGIDDPGRRGTGCGRWPEHLRLVNKTTGELVRGRCRATNLCDYCARLFAVETSEMLLLDAVEDAPTLLVVLTARELLERSACRRHLTQLRKCLRARWPDIRWACLVEFQRRGALHLNLLVKGVPQNEADELRTITCGRWCERVDAEPVGQFVGPVTDAGGAVRYVSRHFMKPGQAPPIGWRGHRYSATRDYLVRPASVMRVEARRSLRLKRLLYAGVSLDVATATVSGSGDGWALVELALGLDLGGPSVRRRGSGKSEARLRDEMARAAREPFARRR